MNSNLHNSPIILASNSPRRRDLLNRLGVLFESVSFDVDETVLSHELPGAAACRLSELKAQTAAKKFPRAIVLASDTIVALDDKILGKPVDVADAEAMLRALRNRRHQVVTAVTAQRVASNQLCTTCCVSDVWMRDYSDDEIAAYVASGDPMDKAGAYAIQHPTFAPVQRLNGCFSGVMGFPLGHVAALLESWGVLSKASPADACGGWEGACCGTNGGWMDFIV